MATPITLSVIKANVGGYVGHSSVHPALLDGAREQVSQAIERKLLIDGYVTHCGDDLQLIMTHQVYVGHVCRLHGNRQAVKLYGAGQDLLSEAFTAEPFAGWGLASPKWLSREVPRLMEKLAGRWTKEDAKPVEGNN